MSVVNKVDVHVEFFADAYCEDVVEEGIKRGILERDELVSLKTCWADLDALREEMAQRER